MKSVHRVALVVACVACGGGGDVGDGGDDGGSDTTQNEASTSDGGAEASDAAVPVPYGMFALSLGLSSTDASASLPTALLQAPAFDADITGVALRVALGTLLPSVADASAPPTANDYNWAFFDALVGRAVAANKKFTLAIVPSNSLPPWLVNQCENVASPRCGAPFEVYGNGAQGFCNDFDVLFPWEPYVQKLWTNVAQSVADRLRAHAGWYESLVMVHVTGISNYTEELRLPSGSPLPQDAGECPDAASDSSEARWSSFGYSATNVIAGWKTMAQGFAQAFPDRYLDQSLVSPQSDFPAFDGSAPGYIAGQVELTASGFVDQRFMLQFDALDVPQATNGGILPEVVSLADAGGFAIGWQSNAHATNAASCNMGSCADGGYVDLLRNGSQTGGIYVEVWPADVEQYGSAFDTAHNSGWYASK